MITFRQIYHEREQAGKNEGQNVQPEEKSSAQKGDVGDILMLKVIKILKKGLMQNRIKRTVTSGQDSIQIILQPVKEKGPQDLLGLR